MGNPKIIAMYLPQFHCIPENDKFWGKGFSDWVSVRKATPLYDGHRQPRIPQGEKYYNLSKEEDVKQQCKLAKEHGIYGFGVYHYWFNNEKNLLTRPAEIMRDCDDIGTKYFFVWDNCSWIRSWSNVSGNDWAPTAENQTKDNDPQVLIPYILGEEQDWKNHYEYVRTHFLSPRYEKRNGKPIFGIINFNKDISRMCDYWKKLAQEDGFEGVEFIFKQRLFHKLPPDVMSYEYQPHMSSMDCMPLGRRILNKVKRSMNIKVKTGQRIYDYDRTWSRLLNSVRHSNNPMVIHGGFVGYDDSPRRGNGRATIIKGQTPEKFGQYMSELYDICVKQEKPYIFLTAWNEWGEGAYLEPDTVDGMSYLNVIKNLVKE